MIETTVKVDGMMCGMCEAHVSDAIRGALPVKKVTASHTKGQAVILSEAPLDEEALRAAIGKTGYEVQGVSARPSAVGVTPPWLRTSSVTPSSSSSEPMAWLTPDWVKFRARAAAVKLPSSTVLRYIWYLVTDMGTPPSGPV